MMTLVRLFIAVDIEDPLLVSRLSELKRTLLATNAPLKPVEDENMHITLLFIGEVPEADVEPLKNEMTEALSWSSFTIRLKGLGAFPSPSRPRVVWVGVEQGSSELHELHKKATTAARRAGIGFKGESFHPHVTLARVKGSRNLSSLTRMIIEMGELELGEMRVTEVRLKKSTLTPRGPIYETLHRVPLRYGRP